MRSVSPRAPGQTRGAARARRSRAGGPRTRRPLRALGAAALLAAAIASWPLGAGAAAQSLGSTAHAPFIGFESSPVRPLLLAPDGTLLYALNTADHRVEIYTTGRPQHPELRFVDAIFTGLEPVAMTLHPDDETLLYVANALSDSVSLVDLSRGAVVHTFEVGDEPQSVAIAGGKLYVATARAFDGGDLVTPGAPVANAVVVAQATPPYAVLARLPIRGHRPRDLAVTEGTVWVVPQNSGNETTSIDQTVAAQLGLAQQLPDAFEGAFEMGLNDALLAPQLGMGQFANNVFGEDGWIVPATGRVVMDTEYPALTPDVPDEDLHAIDVATDTVRGDPVRGLGTTLLALAVNPVTGDLWIANQDANNRRRFEPRLRGDAVVNRVTIVGTDGAVRDVITLAPPFTGRHHAQPAALAFHAGARAAAGAAAGDVRHAAGHEAVAGAGADIAALHAADGAGSYAYVAATGSASVVVLDAVTGALVDELDVPEVPVGLAVDEARGLLYVLGRVDKTIATFAIGAGHAPVGAPVALSYDPEPAGFARGRAHLYDARTEGGHGNGSMSCATCHVSGHTDFLGWDLGDPGGGLGYFFPDVLAQELSFGGAIAAAPGVMMTHPMKGPMVTQSLRGLGDGSAVPLHWRGDRRFFQLFGGAFGGLLGGDGISPRAMQEYANFVRALRFGPNPYQPKDRVYTGELAHGRDLFGLNPDVPGKEYNPLIPGNVTCRGCHTANFADGNNFTGTQRTVNFDAESQLFNSAGLRGVYEKEDRELLGFGLLHDGTIDDIDAFLDASLGPLPAFPALTAQEKDDVAAFVRAWDSGVAPLVGAQRTFSQDAFAGAYAWLELAETQARPPLAHVDLVARFELQLPGGHHAVLGAHYRHDEATDTWRYLTDIGRPFERSVVVQAIVNGLVTATFTCVPPGTGARLGVDREEDGLLDGLERRLGTLSHRPDSDGDGYADGAEGALGGDPLVADALLGDDVAPAIVLAEARDVFTTTATLHVETDEPAAVSVAVALPGGDGAVFADPVLRRVHDVVLDGLPARTPLEAAVTVTDRNGNATAQPVGFTTGPLLLHVDAVALTASGPAPHELTATVRVVDQDGTPIPGVAVRGIWRGDVGGAWWFPTQPTDEQGVASFTVAEYTPSAAGTVTFGVAYVGSIVPGDPWFVGTGNSSPTWFYNQSVNAENHATINVAP